MRPLVVFAFAIRAMTGVAHAEDTSEAQRLFEEGRKLLDEGKTDAACDRFELSIAKDPRAVGTLLNLGLCNERRGKVATALRLFQEAYDRAGDADLPQHREAAQLHIAKLVPQIPVLAIAVASPVEGQSVFVDDKGVKLGSLEVQLDPGPHKIVATAPGRLPFETTIKLAVGDRKDLAIPKLEEPKTVVVGGNPRRTIGRIATISGGVILVASGAMALYARSSYRGEFDSGECTEVGPEPRRLCTESGQEVTDRARSIATGATIVGALGTAALVGGLVLWLTAPSEARSVVPAVTAEGASVMFVGRF